MPDLDEVLQEALGPRYELLGVLGEGGMGIVYLAQDARHERKVAIKTIHPELSSGVLAQRFEEEIRFTARLQHPHILPLLDSGTAGESLYYVMPYVEGESLQGRLGDSAQLPLEEALGIARDVAEALAYAHEHGVIHRDLKPGNIMLTGGHAVLTDFGIAKAIADAGGESLTQTGAWVGSPAYMSPEQVDPAQNIDPRSDIYGLGCVLYRMLTGMPPFVGRTPHDFALQHMDAEVPGVRSGRPDAPPAVEAAVAKALSKDPAERFIDAREFAQTLDDILVGLKAKPQAAPLVLGAYVVTAGIVVILADRLASRYFLPAWVYQGALAVALGGLVLLILKAVSQGRALPGSGYEGRPAGGLRRVTWRGALSGIAAALAFVGLSAATYVGSRAMGIGPAAPLIARGLLEDREPIVLTRFANQTPDTSLALAVTEALRVDLSRSPVVQIVDHDDVRQVLARMERDPAQPLDLAMGREVAIREGIRAVLGGEIHALGSAYILSARLVSADTGEELFAGRETASDAGAIINAIDGLSRRLRERIGESLASVGRSDPLPAITTASLDALKAYARAIEISGSGEVMPALPLLRRAVALDSTFAGAHRVLALYLDVSGDPASGQAAAERAFRFSHRLPQREQALTRAAYYVRFGRLDSASYYYRLLLDSPRDSVTALNNLGDALERMGRYEEAMPLYRRVVRAIPHRSAGHVNVASAARTLGQHELADSALTVLAERFPQSVSTSISRIANAYYRYDLAVVEEIARHWLISVHADARAGGQQWLADLAAMSGRIDESMARADTAARTFLEDGRPALAHQALMLLELAAAGAGLPEAAVEYLLPYEDPLTGGDQADSSPQFHYRMLGLFAHAHALAGKDRDAQELLTRMDSLVAARGIQPTGIGAHVRAVLALSGGRPEESLQHLQQARAAEFGLLHLWSRLLLGQVYLALDRREEAAAEFESLTTTRGLNYQDNRLHGAVRPLAHEQLGPLYLTLGDTTSALRHMAAFVELWEEADPDLQPRVQAVRERLGSLLRARG